jgi:hypothetical protein
MNSRSYLFAVSLAVLAALTTASVNAKGSFNCFLLYGDGKAIEVMDSSLLLFDTFNDFSTSIPGSPSVITPGFLIARGATDNRTGDCTPIDTLRFFPSSLGAGSKPVVYYEGLVNGWSELDGKWYYAKPEAAAALERLLLYDEARGSAVFPPQWLALVLSALAGIAVGTGATALLKRRTH